MPHTDLRRTMPLADSDLPRVVIIGRPNVGKSTLFNRLVGRRQAICHSEPGVTRDIVSSRCPVDGMDCMLFDTGGMSGDGQGLALISGERSLAAANTADLVLLVLSAEGVVPEDEELIEQTRPLSTNLLCVVNKVDDQQSPAGEFFALGLGDPIAISSEHNHNIDLLRRRIHTRLDHERASSAGADQPALPDQINAPKTLQVAIAGQPNSGKSTLLNSLTDSDRALVSKLPGTTRDVVEGEFLYHSVRFRILDTAGIRRKTNVQLEYWSIVRAREAIDRADVLFLIIDACKGLVEQDKRIAALAAEAGRGIILVLNKWDLLADMPNRLQATVDRIRFVFPLLHYAPIIPISARLRSGLPKLLNSALALRSQLNLRIETGRLNRMLGQWVNETPPPGYGRHRWKLRYITQTSVNPLQFILFVNRVNGFPRTYRTFIINRIRSELGFRNVPILLELRNSSYKSNTFRTG